MTVRPAREADIDALAHVQSTTWRISYDGIFSPEAIEAMNFEVRQKRWAEILGNQTPSSRTFVYEDDKVVGFASAGPNRDDDLEGWGEIYAAYVLPHSQGEGRGKALLKECDAFMIATGLTQASVVTMRDMPASRAFYESCGYVLESERMQDDPVGVPVAAVRYTKSLLD